MQLPTDASSCHGNTLIEISIYLTDQNWQTRISSYLPQADTKLGDGRARPLPAPKTNTVCVSTLHKTRTYSSKQYVVRHCCAATVVLKTYLSFPSEYCPIFQTDWTEAVWARIKKKLWNGTRKRLTVRAPQILPSNFSVTDWVFWLRLVMGREIRDS
jgi:hypothetical protein